MKFKHSVLVAFCLSSVISSIAFAESTCSITRMQFVPGYNKSGVVTKDAPVNVVSWQDCYQLAVEIASQEPLTGTPVDIGSVSVGGWTNDRIYYGKVTPKNYVNWTFNDSRFSYFRSHGSVNSLTKTFQLEPAKDKVYFDKSGRSIQDLNLIYE
jgi:hypothetical protein